jgi:hypothetical protein
VPDLAGRIWGGPSLVCFAVVLRWQDALHGKELRVGISANKAAVASVALSHPSCDGGESGLLLVLELRRLELARRSVGPDSLVNKLEGMELLILLPPLFLCAMVAPAKRQWLDLWLHRESLLHIILHLVVASSYHIFISGSAPTTAHRRHEAVQLLYLIVVRRLLQRALVLAVSWFKLFIPLQARVPTWRVFCSFDAAVHVGVSTSGVVPGDSAGGRGFKLAFGGEEGPDGFYRYLSRVLFIKFKDRVVIFFIFKVLLVICNRTVLT